MYRCEVLIPMPQKDTNVIYSAIEPEFLNVNDDRTKCDVSQDSENLKIKIDESILTSVPISGIKNTINKGLIFFVSI